MAAEGYVIFEDTTWYQKHKEEIKEQIISLDTYVRHPMQIGAYLIKEIKELRKLGMSMKFNISCTPKE